MENKYYEISVYGRVWKIRLIKTKYSYNNRLAIVVRDEDETPFTNLTVNLEFGPLEENQAFIDINNNPWAEEFLEKNNIAYYTGISAPSGYCIYPLYEFNLSKLDNI